VAATSKQPARTAQTIPGHNPDPSRLLATNSTTMKRRNPIALAMLRRYGGSTRVHSDKRRRRQTRQSWRKDWGV